MCLLQWYTKGTLFVVETMGIEPMSEDISACLSPGADHFIISRILQNDRDQYTAAFLFMTVIKANSRFTDAAGMRPSAGRSPPANDVAALGSES